MNNTKFFDYGWFFRDLNVVFGLIIGKDYIDIMIKVCYVICKI